MLCLNSNIYIIKGATKACIYDLNNKNMYCISNTFADFLLNLDSYKYVPDNIINSNSVQELVRKKIIVLNDEEKAELIEVEQPIFLEGTIEITQNCNFKCIHCFEGMRMNKTIPEDEVKSIIDQFCEVGIKKIHFFGGEPFIHPAFCEILYYASNKFDVISVTTNASILNERIERCLKEVKPMILASLHSDIEEEFNRVTNTIGMFNIVNDNIKRMQKLGINCQVRKVKINGIKSTDRYERYWSEYSGFPILLGNASIEQYSEDMLKKKVISSKYFEKKLDVNNVLLNMNYQKCFCKNIYVDVEKNVYPCTMERRIKHGNIGNKDLKDVLDDSIIRITKDQINECKFCEYRYACSTCFVDNRSENPYDKPWFCLYEPSTGKWKEEDAWIKKVLNK